MIIHSHGHMIVSGKLGRDAEFRVGGKKQSHFCSFSVAADEYADEYGEKKTRWVDIDAAFELADVARNFKKGDSVLVCGKLQSREYTTRDGEKRTAHELKADFLMSMTPARSVAELAAAFPGVVVDGPDAVDDAFSQFADPNEKAPWEEE